MINLTSLQSLKGRWVNRNKTCIKNKSKQLVFQAISTLLIYRFTTAFKALENTPKRTSLLGFTILQKREEKLRFFGLFWTKTFLGLFQAILGNITPSSVHKPATNQQLYLLKFTALNQKDSTDYYKTQKVYLKNLNIKFLKK